MTDDMAKTTKNLKMDSDSGLRKPKAARSKPVPEHRQRGRRAGQLIVSETTPDRQSLISAARGWLVPLLIEQFFAERRIELTQPRNPSNFSKSNFGTPVQEARAEKRVITLR
jgi:hypothetical protein